MLAKPPSRQSENTGVHPNLEQGLAKLAQAALTHQRLDDAVLDITQSLGFQSFLYVISSFDPERQRDVRTNVWTTLPKEWLALYQRMRYIEVDPRLTYTWYRSMPYVWDAAQFTGEWQVQQFLHDAARFGIRSGVALSFHDARHSRVVVALDSPVNPVCAASRTAIQRRFGDVMLLATSFHDLFMRHVVDQQPTTPRSATPLSPRERQCLQMAARGLTSADIGTKLGITERTANFHFSNLIGKLGVINRHEAIARAVSTGMISFGASD